MNAVDTNVLLYSIDRNEPAKQLKAQQLLHQLHSATEPTLLLWQVLGELTQQLRRWRDQVKLTPVEFSQHGVAFRHLFPLALPTAEAFDCQIWKLGTKVMGKICSAPAGFSVFSRNSLRA